MARGFDATFGVGSTDVLTCAAFTSPTKFSFAGWYYRNGTGGLNAGRIFDKTGAAVAEIALNWRNTSSSIRFARVFSTTAGGWDTTAAAAVATGAWVHIVVVYDGSATGNNPAIYINGQSVSVTTTTAPVGTVSTNSGVLTAGNRSTGSTQWDGILGDQAFWSETLLNAGEARALFQGCDPRTLRPNYLAEHLVMSEGKPYSTIKSSQPVTTGTKYRGDRVIFNQGKTFPFGFVAASGAISGSTTLTFAPSGTLTGSGALAGTSSLAFAPSATLTGAGTLIGASTLVFTPLGTVTGSGELAGASSLTFTPSGTLTNVSPGAMTGSTSITFTVSGTLTGTSSIWTPIAPASGSWANQLAASGTWTPQAAASGSWTPQ